MTLIIGSEGSMGRRYQAILRWLNEPFECHDVVLECNGTPLWNDYFDRFIIATPTHTHLKWVKELEHHGRPILCEKPLSKDLAEVEQILACKAPLSMMMQYKYLAADPVQSGPSSYNYFRHGKDGMIWDCFQIIALARDKVTIRENSPTWECYINGQRLDLREMDWAYIEAVRDFIAGHDIARDQLLAWHKKVSAYEKENAP
jgi:hypothetical protein